MQQSDDQDLVDVGLKVRLLLPRMLLYPGASTNRRKLAVEIRRRCVRFVDGEWPALMAECPAPLGPAQRAAVQGAAVERRGYAVDETLSIGARCVQVVAMALYISGLALVREHVLLVITTYATLLGEERRVIPRILDSFGAQIHTDMTSRL